MAGLCLPALLHFIRSSCLKHLLQSCCILLQVQCYADKLLFGMNIPGPLRNLFDDKCKHGPSELKYFGTTVLSNEETPYKKSYREEKRKERRCLNNTKVFRETLDFRGKTLEES